MFSFESVLLIAVSFSFALICLSGVKLVNKARKNHFKGYEDSFCEACECDPCDCGFGSY